MKLPSFPDFIRIHLLIFIFNDLSDDPVFIVISLDHYFPLLIPPASSARYLRQQLITPLKGAEVRIIQKGIRIDHTD
ncbi:hypothetical protein D3C85_1604640 [compost metagenome]